MIAIPQLVVAAASEFEAILNSDDPTDSWEGIEHALLDRDRLIRLWALAESGSPCDQFVERLRSFPGIAGRDERREIYVMPPRMLAALAALAALSEGGVVRLAVSWARTPELEWVDHAWVLQHLRLVIDVAETAQMEGKAIVLWVET